MKTLAMIVGAAILLTTAHVTVLATGGYGGRTAYITLAVAAGVAVASILVGRAWGERRRTLAVGLVVAIAAGEIYAFVSTAERLTAAREASQAPLRQAIEVRQKLETKVAKAEAAVARFQRLPPASGKRCWARLLPTPRLSPRAPSAAALRIAACCCRRRPTRPNRKSRQRGATWRTTGPAGASGHRREGRARSVQGTALPVPSCRSHRVASMGARPGDGRASAAWRRMGSPAS